MNHFEWYENYKNIIRQKFKLIQFKTIYIALSGGRDSIFLTCLLSELFKKDQLCILHMDHSLRGKNSDGDREFVVNFALSLGINYQVTKISLPEDSGSGGLENIARQKRYEWFKTIINSDHDILCCGHTSDDQLETILMKIYRGTGLAGLRGIDFEQNIFGLRVYRPLLQIDKKTITHFLKSKNIVWREDESNTSDIYFRNFIRQHIGNELSNPLKMKIFHVSMLVNRLREFFAIPAANQVAGGLEFEEIKLNDLSNFELRHLVERVYLYFQNNTGPDKKHFILFQKFLKSSSEHLELPGHVDVYKSRNKLFFKYKYSSLLPQFNIGAKASDNTNSLIFRFPKNKIKDLVFRTANLKEDTINGKKLMSMKNIVQLPKWRRDSLGVIEYKNNVIFCQSCRELANLDLTNEDKEELVDISLNESEVQL